MTGALTKSSKLNRSSPKGAGMQGSKSAPALLVLQDNKPIPPSSDYREQSRLSSKDGQLLGASKSPLTFDGIRSASVPMVLASKNQSGEQLMSGSFVKKVSFNVIQSPTSTASQVPLPLITRNEQNANLVEQHDFLNRAKLRLSTGLQDLKATRMALTSQLATSHSRSKSALHMQAVVSLPPISSQASATATNTVTAISRDLPSEVSAAVAPASPLITAKPGNAVTAADIPNCWQQSGAIGRDLPSVGGASAVVSSASSWTHQTVPVKPLTAGSSSSRVFSPSTVSAAEASSSTKMDMSAWVKERNGQPQERLRDSVKPETVANAVQRLRAKLDGRQIICVLGSAAIKTESEAILKILAKELASRLQHKAVFCTGGRPGLPRAFAEGLIAEEDNQVRLWHVLPMDEVSCYEDSQKYEVRAGVGAAQHQEIFGQLGDLYIIAEGGPEDANIASAAHARGAIIVPLAVTGGASGGLYGFPSAALQCPHWALKRKEAWSHITNSRSRLNASVLASAGADIVESCLAALLTGLTKRPRSQESSRPAQGSFSAPIVGNGGSSLTNIAHSRTILSVGDNDMELYLRSAASYRSSMHDLLKKLMATEAAFKEASATHSN